MFYISLHILTLIYVLYNERSLQAQWAQKVKYGHYPCSGAITLQPKMKIWKKTGLVICIISLNDTLSTVHATQKRMRGLWMTNWKVWRWKRSWPITVYYPIWKIMQPFSKRTGHRALTKHWPWKIKCTWDKHYNDSYRVVIYICLGYWMTLLKLQKFIQFVDMTDG